MRCIPFLFGLAQKMTFFNHLMKSRRIFWHPKRMNVNFCCIPFSAAWLQFAIRIFWEDGCCQPMQQMIWNYGNIQAIIIHIPYITRFDIFYFFRHLSSCIASHDNPVVQSRITLEMLSICMRFMSALCKIWFTIILVSGSTIPDCCNRESSGLLFSRCSLCANEAKCNPSSWFSNFGAQ